MEFVLMFVDMAPTRPFLIFMEAKKLGVSLHKNLIKH